MTRRHLLAGMGSTALINRLGMFNTLAQTNSSPNDYKALVCIQLAGGNDGHNTIVPLTKGDFDDYKAERGSLALPDSNGPLLEVETGNGTAYGLNPGLTHLHPRWDGNSTSTGKLAVLANVGMLVHPVTRLQLLNTQSGISLPTNLFSHSDQVQQIQSGIASTSGGTGWGGRAADMMMALNGTSTFPAAVSLAGPSLFCKGGLIQSTSLFPGFNCDTAGMNLFPQSAANARKSGLQQILQLDSGLKLVQAANQSRQDAMDLNALLSGLPAQLSTPFPATPIGAQLQQVAKIIKIRGTTGMSRQVFFCSMGGFDTHASQSWQQWNLLYDLSEAMEAFYKATEDDLQIPDQVTSFTVSDFGRTLQPSGTGCDHGWGNHHLILGGAVRGGEVYGTFPELRVGGPDDSGSRGAMIPTTAIAQYGSTLARWFGVPDGAAMNVVFPSIGNFATSDLGFMGP
ncbi:MAG: DUF1501 domain-containing protein [Verrucomicrobiales bacterium]|nr:DUF1501 domain-containing protein [Verrucomicrobiales bacterium]MCP5558529.1 DUF1501 domain-containing protein [Verrucomicrobiaceae bacterium]